MPARKRVNFNFKTVLQKGNRIQVPKLIREQLKMETFQALKVTVTVSGFFGRYEQFYAKMNRDGRITIPKLTLALMRDEKDERPKLAGSVIEVQLEPAEGFP
jgi:bifunctional DNA-binding transcriptional regulator/antitoxin component of YhaV-PrlF toxin-antitoxin module